MSSDTVMLLPDEQLIARAMTALFNELGPVEAGRFLALAQVKPVDSVAWHRQWQETLEQKTYLDSVFGSAEESEQTD